MFIRLAIWSHCSKLPKRLYLTFRKSLQNGMFETVIAVICNFYGWEKTVQQVDIMAAVAAAAAAGARNTKTKIWIFHAKGYCLRYYELLNTFASIFSVHSKTPKSKYYQESFQFVLFSHLYLSKPTILWNTTWDRTLGSPNGAIPAPI